MGGTLIVPVLEQLGQRPAKNALVKADCALDVVGQQGDVVYTTRRRHWSLFRRDEVLLS